ncbi:MAG TPA: hypothetical protein VEL76_19905, partial [Gemmataceae bacterium]|nr:hypothetical protein [Gemmataceae bacterium]
MMAQEPLAILSSIPKLLRSGPGIGVDLAQGWDYLGLQIQPREAKHVSEQQLNRRSVVNPLKCVCHALSSLPDN